MKRILNSIYTLNLAILILISSFNILSAKCTPTPKDVKGFYILGHVGEGIRSIKIESKERTITQKQSNYRSIESLMCVWGISIDVTPSVRLAYEFNFISPGIRLGYLINNTHEFSIGMNFDVVSLISYNNLLKNIAAEIKRTENLNSVDLKFNGCSFLGASITYDYFTPTKLMLRLQLRVDYYGITGSFSDMKNGDTIDGKVKCVDTFLYFGIGKQF